MATADEYASWIVKNADKKGTPEFDTVSKAYQMAKGDNQEGPRSLASKVGGTLAAVPETLMHLGSEVAAFPVEGVASAAALATGKPGERVQDARQAVSDVSGAMTYQPRTPEGRALSGGVDTVLGAPGAVADYAGGKVTDVTGSAGAGAATSLAIQSAVAVFGGEGLAAVRRATGAAKPIPLAQAATKAEKYVATRTNLDWKSLSTEFKSKLAKIATDSQVLDNLDPKAVERVGRAQSLGLPISRGQATRNLGQITQEENLQRSEAGQPLRDISTQQDIGLHKKLDEVRKSTGGQADTKLQLGESVQGASRAKYRALKKDYDTKYAVARKAGETAQPADTNALEDFMQVPANKRNLGFLTKAIEDYKQQVSKGDKTEKVHQISINDLERIRVEVNAASKSADGTKRHFAGEAKRVIDQILDNSGGKLYKDARSAFRATKLEFDQQSLIKRLTTEKKNTTDRAIALEDTFDSVVRSGSRDQIKSLIESLTNGGTSATRAVGAKAVKDLQAATIDYLTEKAAGKRGVRGEQEQLQFNSSFIDAVDELDKDGKLDVLFGPQARTTLRQLREATRDLRTKPADRIAGPNTTPRLIAALEKLSKIPIVGDLVSGTAKAVGKLHEMGKEGREVREAATNPVESGVKQVQKSEKKQRKRGNTLRQFGYVAPAAPNTVRDAP